MASKNEVRLARFVELNDQIKVLTKELNTLKEEIREQGTHSTQNYSAIVEFVNRSQVDVDAVKTILGDNTPMKDSSYQTVKVSKKTLV
jgi:predicted phage-related endonuclease